MARFETLDGTSRFNIGCRKLADENGMVVDSAARSDTFAQHLEKMQWAIRPLTASSENLDSLGPEIESRFGDVTWEELRKGVRQLKNNTAAIQVPAEFLKAV